MKLRALIFSSELNKREYHLIILSVRECVATTYPFAAVRSMCSVPFRWRSAAKVVAETCTTRNKKTAAKKCFERKMGKIREKNEREK